MDKKKRYLIIAVVGFILSGALFFGVKVVLNKAEETRIEKERLIKLQEEKLEAERIQKEKEERIEYLKTSDIAYLTFDDGPDSVNTKEVLKVLEKNDIKATFFMVGDMVRKNPDMVKMVYDAGHSIANHTTNHKYRYGSKEAFINDIEDTNKKISEALGIDFKALYVRSPGGSFGKTSQKEALKENEYIDVNWTALNGDSEKNGNVDSKYLLKRINETVGDNQYEVVLMHDIKSVTANNLQKIIDAIKEKGYVFEALTEETPIK